MRFPTPTRKDHQRFCEVEGWETVRNATGKKGTHHITDEMTLPDGQVLRTRVSHPPNKVDIGKGLFSHILRDQLQISEEEFWDCVKNGTTPNRGLPPATDREPLPPELVRILITKVGMADQAVRALAKAEAVQIVQEYWSRDA